MLKLMIADDERVIRETISGLVDWESIGVELIGLCKDGIEAYHMILDESPDIVMTDIRMPGLSGLELVREITQTDQQIQFIILSGYEDFEYAREAMRYGIRHYLLKPCNEEKIAESIKLAGEDCLKARRLLEEKEKQNSMTRTLRQDALYHLFMDGVAMDWEAGSGLKEKLAGLEEFYGPYIDFYQRECWLYHVYYLEWNYLKEVLLNLRREEERRKNPAIFYGVYVKNTLLLFCNEPIEEAALYRLCAPASDFVQIEECKFPNLLKLLERVLVRIGRYDTVYAVHNFEPLSIRSRRNILPHIQKLYQNLESADCETAKALCGELLSVAEQAEEPEVLRLLGSTACIHFPALNGSSLAETAELMQSLNQSEDIGELRKLTEELLLRTREKLCSAEPEYGRMVEQIMEYVQAHLADSSLTLKKICEEHLYMNVDYVSRQFRRITGIKFSQYLTEQRVKRAKELLMNEETGKIQYVADQVGCGNNPQYFSQIFKKTVGTTPGKWALKMQSGRQA